MRWGKPEKGTIRLSAYHEGGHIIIEIADDGRGLNAARIKSRALASGLISEADAEKMSEAQIHKLIFAPGLSTAVQVTSVSGRGVGMDVVKNNLDQIGGAIDVKSVPGEGSSFVLKIPLTLAIVSALIVDVAGDRFAIPQLAVIELVRIRANSEHRIERIRDAPVLRLRNALLPLVHLGALLRISPESAVASDDGFIVVTQVGSQRFGIVVDGVFHTEEIVVKPMSAKLRHITMFSGNTILGDGSVIMIIDPNGVAEVVGTATGASQHATETHARPAGEAEQTTSLLVFRAGSAELKAVPLALVTRLEEVDCRKIELSNGRHLVQYRGGLMPLVRVNDACRVRNEGAQPLLVFSDGGRSMGLVVDEIVDIVEDKLTIDVASDAPGVLGSAIVNGKATEIIDLGHFLPLAFEDWFRRKEMTARGAAASVLLVDDSAFFRNMLPPVLQAAGYKVVTVASGEDALALVKNGQHFDAIISDLEMPGMNGLQLAEALRANSSTAEIPLIALSSHAKPGMLADVRSAGFGGFVAKFDRPGLIAAIKEVTTAWNEAA